MVQPTKDELRQIIRDLKDALREEKNRRRIAEIRLRIATRKIGELTIDAEFKHQAEMIEA